MSAPKPVPGPEITPLSQPYWSGLAEGRLLYQLCANCANAWLPAREECPRCLGDEWAWTDASGRGRIISWVIYRQAVHPAFADRVPYTVAIVELDEGPRLITNVEAEESELGIEKPVRARFEDESGTGIVRFELE